MERRRAIRRVGFVVFAANVLLIAGKTGAQWTTRSLTLGSEAANSLVDAVCSTIILDGLYLTTKPPDWEHPHSHEHIEPFILLLAATGIFAAGRAILWQSTSSILTGIYGGDTGTLGVVVLVVAAAVKYAFYRYCYSVGRERSSPALVAAGIDNRSGILTTEAALVGVVGGQFGYPILDLLAAMVVSIDIVHTGYEIVRNNVSYPVGTAPPEYLRALIVQAVLPHPNMYDAYGMVAHYVGPEIDVGLHIGVKGDVTTAEVHDIETWVVQAIRNIDEADSVSVHIDPEELGEWKEDDETECCTVSSSDSSDDR